MPRFRAFFVAGLATLTLVACSDDAGPDDGGSASGSERCDAFQALADADDAFQADLNAALQEVITAPPEEREAEFEEMTAALRALADDRLSELTDIYDELLLRVPDDLMDEVRTLSEFTSTFIEELAATTSPEEVQNVLRELGTSAEAQAAGEASLALDELSRDECDIVIAD